MTTDDSIAVLRWQLGRAETALSAMEDIGFDKSDAACEIADWADELRAQIAAAPGEDT